MTNAHAYQSSHGERLTARLLEEAHLLRAGREATRLIAQANAERDAAIRRAETAEAELSALRSAQALPGTAK